MPPPGPPPLDPRARAMLRRLDWQIRRGRGDPGLPGLRRAGLRGRGTEADGAVPYAYGDDVRTIDWAATARLGEPYRKLLLDDRETTVCVVVGDDPALQFGSGPVDKRTRLIELAGLALMLAMIGRDRAALLHASGRAELFRPPVRGRAILDLLATLHAQPPPDIAAPFARTPLIRRPLPGGTLVLWFGEIPAVPPPAGWAAFRRRHPTVAVRVEDAWERDGPRGDLLAYDPLSARLVRLRDTPDARAAHARWREEREARWRRWWPDPADRLTVDVAADPLAALVGFFERRRGTAT